MKRKVNFNFNIANKAAYSIIALMAIIIIGMGVLAFGTNNPSTFGHSTNEIAPPSLCAAGQVLQWNGNSWMCVSLPASADTSNLQARVTGTCSAGQSIRVINADGTVTCEIDDSPKNIQCQPELFVVGFGPNGELICQGAGGGASDCTLLSETESCTTCGGSGCSPSPCLGGWISVVSCQTTLNHPSCPEGQGDFSEGVTCTRTCTKVVCS